MKLRERYIDVFSLECGRIRFVWRYAACRADQADAMARYLTEKLRLGARIIVYETWLGVWKHVVSARTLPPAPGVSAPVPRAPVLAVVAAVLGPEDGDASGVAGDLASWLRAQGHPDDWWTTLEQRYGA